MKKHFYLFPAFLLFAIFSQAQIKQGQVLLGGNIGFLKQTSSPISSANDGQTNQTNILLNPSFGKAIKENLVLGFDLDYSHAKMESEYAPGPPPQNFIMKSDTYGAGIFLRRYKSLGNGFYLFMQGRLGGDYTTQNNDYISVNSTIIELKRYNFSLGFFPGISYAISKKVQLETGFQNLVYAQYDNERQTIQQALGGSVSSYRSNSFSLSTSLSNSLSGFVVGFRVLMGS
jgi:hypothetical protein